MESHADDWSQYLDSAVFSINTSVQSSTKFTPFLIMFGREALFPLEAEKEVEQGTLSLSASSMDYDYDDYVKKIFEKQRSIFGTADKRIKEKQKGKYLKRKGITKCNFKTGEMVLRRNMKQKTRKGSKHEDRWLGPYTIAELTKTNCVLINKLGKRLKTRININQLKPYIISHSSS